MIRLGAEARLNEIDERQKFANRPIIVSMKAIGKIGGIKKIIKNKKVKTANPTWAFIVEDVWRQELARLSSQKGFVSGTVTRN